MKPTRISAVLLGLYWVALFLGTHVPARVVHVRFGHDKVWHFVAFSGLAFLLASCLGKRGRTAGVVAVTLVAAILYATVDEMSQMLVPGRQADLWDWAADLGGAVVGIVACLGLRRLVTLGREAAAGNGRAAAGWDTT